MTKTHEFEQFMQSSRILSDMAHKVQIEEIGGNAILQLDKCPMLKRLLTKIHEFNDDVVNYGNTVYGIPKPDPSVAERYAASKAKAAAQADAAAAQTKQVR